MSLTITPPANAKPDTLRHTLWRKRLAREARIARRNKWMRGDRPYGDPPRVALFRWALRMLGLYRRGLRNANTPVLREAAFTFDGLPPAFDGFRILVVSDFHFNNRPGFMDAVCALAGNVTADLCVMTGDYRFGYSTPYAEVFRCMERFLSCINARHGVIGVLGNNDESRFVPAFRAMGIRMLVNESLELPVQGESLWLAGVDDPHEYHCDSVDAAFSGIPRAAFTILLAHSPELIREAAERGVDLYLCGHTHGGQIALPWGRPLYINARCPRRYGTGPWRYGQLHGYTTIGIGACSLPIRFASPPEAVLIELKGTQSRETKPCSGGTSRCG